jgi:hypothetical protein
MNARAVQGPPKRAHVKNAVDPRKLTNEIKRLWFHAEE